MPYLTSAQVTGLPSCQVAPLRRVKLHAFPPSAALPVSVARSGARAGNESCRVADAQAVRVRWNTLPAKAMSAPTLSRCGSHTLTGPCRRMCRVPPAVTGTLEMGSIVATVLAEQDANTRLRARPTATAVPQCL